MNERRPARRLGSVPPPAGRADEASPAEASAGSHPVPAAPATRFVHLRKRADFLRAAAGTRYHATALTIQAAQRPQSGQADGDGSPRFGFTVTKKVGGAVERNRIRRRLREALRTAPALATRPGYDYVVLARRDALAMPFHDLVADLDRGVRRVHDRPARGGRRAGRPEDAMSRKTAGTER